MKLFVGISEKLAGRRKGGHKIFKLVFLRYMYMYNLHHTTTFNSLENVL